MALSADGAHPKKRITIIGAGLAGLTLGRCLKHKGIPAVVYERTSPARRHDYGITLRSSTYQPLLSMLQMDESTFRNRLAVDAVRNGDQYLSSNGVCSSSFRCHRGKFEQLLRESLDINWSAQLKGIKIRPLSENSIAAAFEDPTHAAPQRYWVESQCLVGCDGPHSASRLSLGASVSMIKVLPFVVFNGKRHFSNDSYAKNISQYLQETLQITTRKGDIRLEISYGADKADGAQISYIFSRPAREGVYDPLHKPDRKTFGAKDIPEEFYEELKSLEPLLEEPFKSMFQAESVRKDRVLHWLMRSVMPIPEQAQKLADHGVILIGDAVHAVPILGGEGANMAIKDGINLAEHIAAKGLSDLRSFSVENHDIWKQAVIQSEESLGKMHRDAPKSSL
ncbi:MAG: hypothetical protein MMC33_010177 [Icmadophila ericetorum]|nr:hypothetical protein [Icmadophila ericetorum]